MDEIIVDSIRVRTDLVGDYQKTDKLVGYKAEMFLRKLIKNNEEVLLTYIQETWGFAPYVQWLPHIYVKKYKNYIKDKEARKYIYEKYAERQSLIEILCNRLIDLDSKECIRLKEFYEENLYFSDAPAQFKIIDQIIENYKEELKLLIPDDTTKIKNL